MNGDGRRRRWEGAIPAGCAGRRLDQALGELVPGLSRSQAQRLIREGQCLVEGEIAKASQRVAAGAEVVLEVSEPESTVAPERAPLSVLYEDDEVIVVNKPAGMAAHPARGTPAGTLLNVLAGHLGEAVRPTLVHRLDRDTSGAMLAAKTVAAHRDLKQQMEERRLKRHYWALVWGDPQARSGTIEAAMGRERGDKTRMAVWEEGQGAVTHWRALQRVRLDGETATLLEVWLQTGRTHQIRVHAEWLGHPLVGERVYRGERGELTPLERDLPGQALHSRRLAFDHPATGERVVVEAALPEGFEALVGGAGKASR